MEYIKVKFLNAYKRIPAGYVGSYPVEQAQRLLAQGLVTEIKEHTLSARREVKVPGDIVERAVDAPPSSLKPFVTKEPNK